MSIADLGSSNGTYVNDERITLPIHCEMGDIIRLGNIVFKFFAQGTGKTSFHDKIYRMATIDGGTQTQQEVPSRPGIRVQIQPNS